MEPRIGNRDRTSLLSNCSSAHASNMDAPEVFFARTIIVLFPFRVDGRYDRPTREHDVKIAGEQADAPASSLELCKISFSGLLVSIPSVVVK